MVIVVRTDLGMGKGKLCSQVAHAALAVYNLAKEKNPSLVREWEREGAKKVVLKVGSEEELLDVYRRAVEKGLPSVLIKDRGLTQIPPSFTAVGIGPEREEKIDEVTGNLRLL
jgi:PTH2 family peptidyl-tRNA hydrolase